MSTAAAARALPALSATTDDPIAFVGGYTDKASKSLGIYAYSWNAKTGNNGESLISRGVAESHAVVCGE
jgi:hypothetical protein